MFKRKIISKNENSKQEAKNKNRKIIGFSILGVFLVLVVVFGIYIYQAINQPESLFNASSEHQQLTPKPMAENIDGAAAGPTSPPKQISDQHIINVLLLGLDLDEKPYAKDGGDFHTDSIIVLAVNFDKNTVDMISLPRDTFTHVPGVKGIYKLNAAVNCGGGKTDSGFKKVCEAASWLLGGINIDYYYAFELDTVKQIGDMIGGVDFNVDMSYIGSSGKHYHKGKQHLDGTGIYDYMRARKNATGEFGDKGRMNRGKEILKAIFKKLKEKDLLTQIPELLSTVNEGLYTNTTLQQSIALANFAYNNINSEDIRSHTMAGKIRSALDWNFYFIDQEERTKLISQTYGIDVAEQEYVSYEYAKWMGKYGFKSIRFLATAYELSQYIDKKGTDTLSPQQKQSYEALKSAYQKAQAAYDVAAKSLDSNDNKYMETTRDDLRKITETCAEIMNYPYNLSWSVKSAWNEDPCINEIYVNFH